MGRRCPDDERQIKRWRAVRRHVVERGPVDRLQGDDYIRVGVEKERHFGKYITDSKEFQVGRFRCPG